MWVYSSLETYGLNSWNGSNLWVAKLDPVEAYASLWLVKLETGGVAVRLTIYTLIEVCLNKGVICESSI